MAMGSHVSPEAGQSASERARLTREKIQRLEQSADAWEAGAAGEQATGAVLSQLESATWTVWHDVRWPGRARANIDHVVVGPPGVFVIDSKNWSGQLSVADGVLKQNGYCREAAVVGVAEAGLAVFQLIPDVPVHPVMCFVREESFTGWVRDVMLCSTNNLDVMLQTRPHVLSTDQVAELATRLNLSLRVAGSSTRLTRRSRPARTGAATPAPRARRSSAVRPLLVAGMGLLLIGALISGMATPVTDWISKQVVESVVPEPQRPIDDSEPRKKGQRDQERQRQRQ
jgi:hypothetical protein